MQRRATLSGKREFRHAKASRISRNFAEAGIKVRGLAGQRVATVPDVSRGIP
jgi:hypothetical protein